MSIAASSPRNKTRPDKSLLHTATSDTLGTDVGSAGAPRVPTPDMVRRDSVGGAVSLHSLGSVDSLGLGVHLEEGSRSTDGSEAAPARKRSSTPRGKRSKSRHGKNKSPRRSVTPDDASPRRRHRRRPSITVTPPLDASAIQGALGVRTSSTRSLRSTVSAGSRGSGGPGTPTNAS